MVDRRAWTDGVSITLVDGKYIYNLDEKQEDKAIKELVDQFGIKKWTIVA